MAVRRDDCPATPGGFGLLLRRHRTSAGLTQVRLAERSGYYVNYLRKLERGERRPSQHVTVALADALELSSADREIFERVARHGVTPQPSMVGRARELGILEEHLGPRQPGLLLLSGEPGIGKTRLLAAARELAGERGMLVLEAGCVSGSNAPLLPIQEALERPLWSLRPEERIRFLSGCERLSRLIAESIGVTFQLRPVYSAEEEQHLLFEAAARYLARLAAGREIVLLLDDVHHADGETLDLIGRLLWLSELPLHIVATCRDTHRDLGGSVDGPLGDLVRAGLAGRLPLEPLTYGESDALLDELLGDAVGPEARERIIQRAGGVPGLLVSLSGGPIDGPVPEEVAEEVLARVRLLPPAGQKALAIVAAAGGAASLRLLVEVSRASEEELVEGLTSACVEGLLESVDPQTYASRCGIIGEVVAAAQSPSRQAALRKRIAEATRRLGDETRTQPSPNGRLAMLPGQSTGPEGVSPAPAPGWCTGA